MREKHPMAGTPVEVTSGPHKGKYIIVIDWLQNQYQGKAMEKIYESHGAIMHDTVRRHGLDDKIVFGKLYPYQTFVCVHDTEIQVLTKSDAKRLTVISGGKDDSRRPSEGDNQTVSSEGPESDGCTVSSAACTDGTTERSAEEVEADKPAGRKGRKSKETTKQ